jgi:xylitol oxidase
VAKTPRLRVVGTRHSFNRIADTDAEALSLERLPLEMDLDRERRRVSVSAGVRYGELAEQLEAQGFALHNLASLPHISVAGACATATHGSGDANGNLATAVRGIEMVRADGSLIRLDRASHPDTFPGAVVALGALGVVTKVTLQVEPTFAVRQFVYERLPFTTLLAHFDSVTSSAYSVSCFTSWSGPTVDQVWRKERVAPGETDLPDAEWFGARLAPEDRHPIGGVSAENCTPQCGIPGPWHERLPHFRMGFTPSSGQELQTEYLVPRAHALPALEAIDALRERIAPLLLISEIRTIAADDLWLSPAHGQPCIGIHFTWKPDWPAVEALLPTIEAALAPFDARPHWGKLFTLPGEQVQALYAKLPAFRALRQQFDPSLKFDNAFLAAAIGNGFDQNAW